MNNNKQQMKKIEITRVEKHGSAEQEYVLMRSNIRGNIEGLMIIDQTQKEGKPSNLHRHPYFFPDLIVNPGEYISLRTGKHVTGKNYVKGTLSDKKTVCHRFFWGLESPVWNDTGKEAVELRYTVILDSKDLGDSEDLFSALRLLKSKK